VLAMDPQTLSINATCFQYHEYGRRAGLKIRSSQGGVGSSPTFGSKTSGWVTPNWVAVIRPRQGIAMSGPRTMSIQDSLSRFRDSQQ
jgi:hypothetical protein